jgi:hypothetical protein
MLLFSLSFISGPTKPGEDVKEPLGVTNRCRRLIRQCPR